MYVLISILLTLINSIEVIERNGLMIILCDAIKNRI